MTWPMTFSRFSHMTLGRNLDWLCYQIRMRGYCRRKGRDTKIISLSYLKSAASPSKIESFECVSRLFANYGAFPRLELRLVSEPIKFERWFRNFDHMQVHSQEDLLQIANSRQCSKERSLLLDKPFIHPPGLEMAIEAVMLTEQAILSLRVLDYRYHKKFRPVSLLEYQVQIAISAVTRDLL